MNVRCDPDKGGCGTLFTVGAISCPNCQRPAEEIGTANTEGLQPRELAAVGESEPEPVIAEQRTRVAPRRRSGGDQNEQNSNDTDE